MKTNDNINLNEQLFWKVIHNKYIFNLIFIKIHEISNDIEQTHHIKSYKFKDIKSVTWMIRYGAFNLLKYKLSNTEPIEISEYCLWNMVYFLITNQFLNRLIGNAFGRTIQRDFYEYEIKKLNLGHRYYIKLSDKLTESIKMIIFEIIELLLKNYRTLISNIDIITQIFNVVFNNPDLELESLMLIRTFVSKPYSLVLTPCHFKYVILYFELYYVKRFIDIAFKSNCNIVDQSFRDVSLLIVLNKKKNDKPEIDQQVLKFILDNPQYHSQSYDPKYTPEERNWSNGPDSFCNSIAKVSFYDISHDIGKRDISTFFVLDQDIQIKLLSLKYFNTYKWKEYDIEISSLKDEVTFMEKKHKLRKQRDEANQFIYDINYNSDHLDPISKINAINHFFKEYFKNR